MLREISFELHHGHGFKVLRGLPVSKHNREENLIIYAGVSSHIASIRGRQDNQYEGKPADVVLNHIKDLSSTADKDKIGAPAYTTDKQVFHTDSGDIVSLFALSTAAEGGVSRLASTWRVYNELAETRPDLIRTLAEPWPADKYVADLCSFLLCKSLLTYAGALATKRSHTRIDLCCTMSPPLPLLLSGCYSNMHAEASLASEHYLDLQTSLQSQRPRPRL